MRLRPKEILVITANFAKPEAKIKRGPLPRTDERLYPRRTRPYPWWDFYDLGTRLRAVASPSSFLTGTRDLADASAVSTAEGLFLEYVEYLFSSQATINIIAGVGVPLGESDVYNFGHNHVQVDPDDAAAVAAWDAVLLSTEGTDPFGTTRLDAEGSRSIPNVMPIKHYGTTTSGFFANLPNDIFDVEVYGGHNAIYQNTENASWRAYTLGRSFASGLLANPRWVTPDDADADPPVTERKEHENWNPLSLEQFGVDIEPRGRLDMKDAEDADAPVNIRIVCPNTYESFDTGDTVNYKVTTEPSFAADEVAFEATTKTKLKFYLKPRWFGFYRFKRSTYTTSWSYETYRENAGDGTYFNQMSGPTAEAEAADPFWSFLVSRKDGTVRDNPVGDGTATFTFNRTTGEYSVTGVPGGDFSGTAPGLIPGFRGETTSNAWYSCTVMFSTTPGGVESYDAPYNIAWQAKSIASGTDDYQNFGTLQQYTFQIGGHIGRLPVFPRMVRVANWSELNAPSPNPRVYSDGSTKLFDAVAAAAMPGQSLSVNSSDNDLADAYKRHALRDKEAYLGMRTAGIKIKVPPASGSFADVTVTPPPQGERVSVSGIEAFVASENAAILAEVTAALTGPHLRNVVINESGADGETVNGNIGAVPVDLPVGALCGVITKKNTKYYIWRKTAETRRTYDYERRQMHFSLSTEAADYLDG